MIINSYISSLLFGIFTFLIELANCSSVVSAFAIPIVLAKLPIWDSGFLLVSISRSSLEKSQMAVEVFTFTISCSHAGQIV